MKPLYRGLAVAALHCLIAFSIAGKGYLGTGNTGAPGSINDVQKDFWMYDPAINVWTQKADFGGSAVTCGRVLLGIR